MPYNRNGNSGGRSQRSRSNFDGGFGGDDMEDFGPRSRAPSGRGRKRPGSAKRKAAPRRSRDFLAGQAHERQRMAAVIDAPDGGYEQNYDNGNGNGRGRGDREVGASRVRIGYRL